MVSHPTYDPGALASHDLKAVAAAWKAAQRRPDPARWSTAPSPATSTRRARRSSSSPRRRRCDSGKFTEDERRSPARPCLDLPQTTADLPNDDGQRLRPGQQVDADPTRCEISCNTAFGWLGHAARRRRAARPGREVRLRRRAARCRCGSRPSSVPGRAQPAAAGPVGDRPVRRAGHAAADGHGPRGDRQPRRGHEALPGARPCRGSDLDGHRPHQPGAALAGGQPPRWPRS